VAIKEHFEGKRDLGLIDPRKLSVDPGYNVRDLDKPEAREGLDYLKSLIRASGVQAPLRIREDGVRADGSANLLIVRGHRRHKVVMELIAEGHPIKLVPVTQEPRGTTPAERNWDLIDSNSEEPLKGFERADALYRQIHTFGWTEEEILRRTGKTKQWLDQQLELRTVAPESRKMVDEGKSSLTLARQTTREHGDKAPEILKKAAEASPNKRATPRAVAKVTGKRPAQSREMTTLALDYMAIANEIEDAAKLAGGVDKLGPERTKALLTKTLTTLAKSKGQKVEEPRASEPSAETGAPVSGAQSLDQLKEEITLLTEPKPEDDAIAEQRRRDAAEFEAAAPKVLPYASSKVDKLLAGFIAADAAALARQYAQLLKEFEDARGYGQHTDAQEQLCIASDVIGQLRFPDDWENAKATAELSQVAA
jgi:hypothetical protein